MLHLFFEIFFSNYFKAIFNDNLMMIHWIAHIQRVCKKKVSSKYFGKIFVKGSLSIFRMFKNVSVAFIFRQQRNFLFPYLNEVRDFATTFELYIYLEQSIISFFPHAHTSSLSVFRLGATVNRET